MTAPLHQVRRGFSGGYATAATGTRQLAIVIKTTNLASGAREHLVFGRNESGLQHRHQTWEEAINSSA
jgi:hypothetical protein